MSSDEFTAQGNHMADCLRREGGKPVCVRRPVDSGGPSTEGSHHGKSSAIGVLGRESRRAYKGTGKT